VTIGDGQSFLQMWKPVPQPQLPARPQRPSIGRVVFILGLAGATVLLAAHTSAFQPSALHQANQSAVHLTLSADVLYRLSIFAQASGQSDQAETLRQMALALYERNALGPTASAQAAYRLGIFYSKSGYPDHGRHLLLQAAQLDQPHHRLYLLLSHIYGEGPPYNPPASGGIQGGKNLKTLSDEGELRQNVALLDDQPRWLAGLTRADLYDRLQQHHRSQQLRQQWQRQQALFGMIVIGLMLICGVMGLAGLVILTSMIVGLARRPIQRSRKHWYVPWHIVDIMEVIVVLVFLMVALGLLMARFGHYLQLPDRPGLTEALLTAAVYLIATGAVLALIHYRISAHPRPWRLLGVRFERLATGVGWGLAGYAVFVGLLGAGWFVVQKLGLAGPLPAGALNGPVEALSQPQTPAAYAVYFVLICLIAPVVEEIVFRGFIYAGLRRVMGMVPAMLLSAALFASIHLSVPTGGMVVVGLIALVLAYLYEHSQSVVPSIVTHFVHNALVFAFLAAYGLL